MPATLPPRRRSQTAPVLWLLVACTAAGCTGMTPVRTSDTDQLAASIAARPADPQWRQHAAAAVAEGDFVRARGLALDALLCAQDASQRAALGRELAQIVAREAEADRPRLALLARARGDQPGAVAAAASMAR